MGIEKDTIFFFVWQPLSDEEIKDLTEIIEIVGEASMKNASKVGVFPGKTFNTKAYTEIGGRYFRITLNFRGIPFKIRRCQVDEIEKHLYEKGIEEEKDDPTKTTEWL